jgi:hypothetical protein
VVGIPGLLAFAVCAGWSILCDMASPTKFSGFLDQNEDRAYPFTDSGDRLSTLGVRVPDNFLVDLSISIPVPSASPPWMSSLSVSSAEIVATFGADSAEGVVVVGTVRVPAPSHSKFSVYPIRNPLGNICGQACVGEVSTLLQAFRGTLVFAPSQTQLEASCVAWTGVGGGIEVIDQGISQGVVTGPVKLIAGDNVRLTRVPGTNAVRIDAVRGENLDDCVSREPCIKTINGQTPDDQGNFRIVGSECVSVSSSPGMISIKDLCSSTCCDCDDFTQMLTGIRRVETNSERLRDFLNSLNDRQQQVIAALLLQLQQ